MPNDKFLQQVARYYTGKNPELPNTVFVFPNRRSALFMHKYMRSLTDKPLFKPRMISITHFTQYYSQLGNASNTELIFILYDVYRNVLKTKGREDQTVDFDRFYFWGNIILNDFSDVDAYMVDAKQLYRNLKGLKEIRANYLTPEQLEVIRQLWGEDYIAPQPDTFWQHIPEAGGEDSVSTKFLHLWAIMYDMYTAYTAELKRRKIGYAGMHSRLAYEHIKDMGKEDFKGQKYVFVGFNVLSTARIKIFGRLKDLGIAEFFWDTASDLITDERGLRGANGHLILPLAKNFKMPSDFELAPIMTYPEIEVISVPSGDGQTKITAKILKDWSEEWKRENPDGHIDDRNLIDTAVVLADEKLLMPMLYSIPEDIKTLNVTINPTYASSPFGTLFSSIISLHLRARKTANQYYFSDVVDILSHPYISRISPEQSDRMIKEIQDKHYYMVGETDIARVCPDLSFIFTQITDQKDINHVRAYIDGLIKGLKRLVESQMSKHGVESYEMVLLNAYESEVKEICRLITNHRVTIHEHTLLQMIERTLSQMQVKFTGQPVEGLQVMSVMDTRALDFDNLILTSINERVFPQRNYKPSLIPVTLRSAFSMPTQENEESTYSYQFYRLISRAKRVKILYDSRTGGLTSGEMSRYLAQMMHLHPELNIKTVTAEFKPEAIEHKSISIGKSTLVKEELRRFFPGGDLRLSATALKTYLKCPLLFYIEFVKGLRLDEENPAYIDAASYGTVIHKVVQDLFLQYKERSRGHLNLSEEILTMMQNDNLERRALETLNEVYYKNRYDNLTHMPGESKIVAKIIAVYVKHMLEREKHEESVDFIGAEVGEKKTIEWRINDRYTINFTMSIDRIDRYNVKSPDGRDRLKFIDYKTGSDELKAENLETMLVKTDKYGIFQVLLYCYAFASLPVEARQHISADPDPLITPMIYKFQTIPKEGITKLRFARKDIEDYRNVSGFYEAFEEIIDKIFDDEHPFDQTPYPDHCTYCKFKQVCGQ